MRNKKIIASITILVLGLAVLFYILRPTSSDSGDSKSSISSAEQTQEADSPAQDESSIQETDDGEEDVRPDDDAPSKDPIVVSEKPLIYTGFGHSEDNPLPDGVNTSTSCTTDANIECTITATNLTTQEKYVFTPQTTNQEGVTLWRWTGGEELSSGAWSLVASAGDKSSDAETIYVQ